jgi:hypothetical protein
VVRHLLVATTASASNQRAELIASVMLAALSGEVAGEG